MGWIAISHKNGAWVDPVGMGRSAPGARPSPDLIRRGTILIETRLSAEMRPQILFAFERTRPGPGRFSLQALPNGGLVLVDAQGHEMTHGTLPFVSDGRLDVLRLTYSWDVNAGWARLTLERPESELIQTVEISEPRPISVDDLRLALEHDIRCDIGEAVSFVAVSDEIEPVGPMPGLTADVPITTMQGEKRAAEIVRGDLVVTDGGDVVPVLQVVKRMVPAHGSFRPIRLRAPYFGLKRDIAVAPQARLVMHGTQVEYMFGREAVLVPARHLVNESSAFVAKGPDLVTYHHLLLPGHEVLMAHECPLESLYIGRLRRKPEALASSVLAGFDRARLPEHAKPVWPVLKPFEAITLVTMHAA